MHRFILCLALALLFVESSSGQQADTLTQKQSSTVASAEAPTITKSEWQGYEKQSFALDDHAAFVVVPKVAAPGNPWIWRTSFPNFHSEVDQELVHNGFHIGYIDVVAMLGSDASLDVMDRFYEVVRLHWNLAARPALEPCSRGGLHAYRYAVRHPGRVACIFGDVPVMDLKSWPLGWPQNKAQVADALKHYGFASIDALREYKGNPIDTLDAIAQAKIPLRHVICMNDEVVPPQENTLASKRRLQELGHDMDLVMVEHSDDFHGHHFAMPEVFQSARFVMTHASVMPRSDASAADGSNTPKQAQEYFKLRNGLANSLFAFRNRKQARVAFLGGSITHGGGWRDELMRDFKLRFPETEFDFIAAGIPSVGSNGHAFRLQRDILMRGPVDLVFVEAAVNDGSNIPNQPAVMRRAMEGVVRHLRMDNPMIDIVHMHFAMGPHLDDYASGRVPVPIAEHEKSAEHYGCVSLNITHEVADRIRDGQFTWESGFRSNVHPPPFGQRVYTNSMTRMLDAALSTKAQPKPHPLPESMVDPLSYTRGRFGNLDRAKLSDGFTLDPAWKPARGRTRPGFADVPALVAETAGAEFTYEFDGTAIGLFLAAGYDSCVLQFKVDDGEFKKVDTTTQWSKGLHLPWPLILADDLPRGPHRLTVQTTDDAPSRTALHVIHILEN